MLFCILDLFLLKKFIQHLIVFLHPLPGLLFDNIQLDADVINVYVAILLHYPSVQLNLIN